MKNYVEELTKAMTNLANKPNTVFVGQAVEYQGTSMFGTLNDVPLDKRIELPVDEDFQMGISIGLANTGFVPISIFPRWNFLLLAANQLINHLDKQRELELGSGKIIIRVGVGSQHPLHPGVQHVGDFTDAFRLLCPNLNIVNLNSPDEIFDAYMDAYENSDGKSSLIVEYSDMFDPNFVK